MPCRKSASAPAHGRDATPTDLGTLGGSYSAASAINDVNDDGVVVGSMALPSGDIHAFRWTTDFGLEDLGTLTTVAGPSASVGDVDVRGMIAGSYGLTDGTTHAVLQKWWKATFNLASLGGTPAVASLSGIARTDGTTGPHAALASRGALAGTIMA